MDIYQNKPRIKLTPTVRYGRKFIEAAFDDDSLRIPLSKEEGIQLVGGKAYLPEEHFVLAEFFDRYVKMAFIDYSSIRELGPRKQEGEIGAGAVQRTYCQGLYILFPGFPATFQRS